eukprot:gene11195-13051_t
MRVPTKNSHGLLHFVAGGLGGAVGVVMTSPLEVIKTQLQGANSSLLYVGKPRFVPTTPYALYNLAVRDGLKGFYKGLGPHLLGVAPARAVHFSTYNFTKKTMKRFGFQDGPMLYLTSAVSAGCTVAVATSPIWLIKTRMQLQTSLKNFNTVSVIREEGVFGFYKGLGASIIGVTESAFQFVLYEGIKERIIQEKKKYPEKYPYPTAPGAVPKYKGVLQGMYLIGKEEGLRGLFGGMGAHVARVVPNSAIMFLTYEFVLDVANKVSKTFSP